MKETAVCLMTGLVCGVVFGVLKLPIPAPPTVAGIAGIIGIFVGFLLARQLRP